MTSKDRYAAILATAMAQDVRECTAAAIRGHIMRLRVIAAHGAAKARDVEHVIIQTGGSWGSACGYYTGSEYAKPEPFTGWEGAQS